MELHCSGSLEQANRRPGLVAKNGLMFLEIAIGAHFYLLYKA